VHRPADGEHVGYLAPAGDDAVVPLTLVGTALGNASSRDAATSLLVERGLAELARRWFCRLPPVLPPGVLAAVPPQGTWAWRPVVLVEVSPTGARLRPEWPAPEERTAGAELPVPVGDHLRPAPPG
jgi:hypothetical protein